LAGSGTLLFFSSGAGVGVGAGINYSAVPGSSSFKKFCKKIMFFDIILKANNLTYLVLQ